MNPTIKPTVKHFTVLHLFCGLGGGAIGFQQARGIYGALEGRFRTLGGVDIDREACADFERLTGAKATIADMHSMTKDELRAAAGGEDPDVIFSSPPCKGYSGLLSNKRSSEEKYQKLNRLVFEGLFLALETFKLPKLIVIENVPRIQNRGAVFLAQVRQLLSHYGYVFHEGTHDCGEVGGLAQHRKRFLMVARQPKLVPTYVYKPAKQRVRAVGEVLSELPLPDDPRGGPMHVLPRLEWRTWVRLALIPAGGDWRALGTRSEDAGDLFNNHLRIVPWDGTSGAVTAGGTPTAGGISVADPLIRSFDPEALKAWEQRDEKTEGGTHLFKGKYGVGAWDQLARTVIGGPSNGAGYVVDPRFEIGAYPNAYRVVKWTEPTGTITGNGRPSAGSFTVADPRMTEAPGRHFNKMRVEAWDGPAHTVTGSDRVGSGAPSVADPRFSNLYRVERWNEPAHCITGAARVMGGAPSVADPRISCAPRAGTYGVMDWEKPEKTITGSSDVHAGASAVADPHVPKDSEQLDPPPVIISTDDTWHRPLTTLELAALQALPVFDKDGAPLQLAGRAQTRWRERIGNAVPPPAARAIAESLLDSLLPSWSRATFVLGSGEIWVRRRTLDAMNRRDDAET